MRVYLRDGSAQTRFTCRHTEIEIADQTFHLRQSQYTDTGRTSPSTNPITPGAWWIATGVPFFKSHWYDSTPKKSRRKRNSNPGSSALETDVLTTWPTRRLKKRWVSDKLPVDTSRVDLPSQAGSTYHHKQGRPTITNRVDLPSQAGSTYHHKQGRPTTTSRVDLPSQAGSTYHQGRPTITSRVDLPSRSTYHHKQGRPTITSRVDLPSQAGSTYHHKQGRPTITSRVDLPSRSTYHHKQGRPTITSRVDLPSRSTYHHKQGRPTITSRVDLPSQTGSTYHHKQGRPTNCSLKTDRPSGLAARGADLNWIFSLI